MPRPAIPPLALFLAISALLSAAEQNPAPPPTLKPSKPASVEKQPTPDEELQQAIKSAANDRAALVRNLESYLQKYPQSSERPQIFRALVEATIQLQDTGRAANYAERLVAIKPEDMSITLLAIQLLERSGDEAGLHRSVNYATRVLEYVDRSNAADKSPKISLEEWQTDKKRDRMSILLLRGRIELKLKDLAPAQRDFEGAYALIPNAASAQKLGEIAELNKNLNQAIAQYARAFALADGANGGVSRRDIRQNLGNVWRLAHGSDDGLGEYLLRTYDEVAWTSSAKHEKKNGSAHQPSEFVLRKAPDGAPFPLSQTKGKVLVVSFWATWCGPCRAQEPLYERVAASFAADADVFFLAADCDDDETLVAPYLQEEKMRTTVVFADGLDSLFGVNSYPTVVVIDRSGKIAYRSEGFEEASFEPHLASAVNQALRPQAVTSPEAVPAPATP
jgi:thiol-disulfide isomerase/thioredoxin